MLHALPNRIGHLIALLLLCSGAQAVTVQIDPGSYTGQYDIDLDGNFITGPTTVDLDEGWHRIRPGPIIAFFVAASLLLPRSGQTAMASVEIFCRDALLAPCMKRSQPILQ